MKRKISLLFCLWASLACAQSAQPISGRAFSQFGQPIPYAQIRVCNVTSTGTPCTPIATIYQDYNLSIQIPNPTSADQYGNYTFYVGVAAPNLYIVQVSADQGLTWSYVQNGPATGGGGGGGVSLVGLNMPSPIFGVTGSPVTSSGTIAVTLATEAANTFLAGPASGSAAAPTFRLIASADLPLATSGVSGAVRPDNTTLTVTGGVLSVVGGGAGVTAINTLTGAFSFTGAVTCTPGSPNVCAFSGGSGGGVNPGTINQLPYYDSTSTVHGDSYLADTAPTNTTSGLLTYTGPGGSLFNTTSGGSFNFTTSNAGSILAGLDSQINLTSTTSLVQAGAVNPGQITVSTADSSGMANAANVDIVARESGTSANTNQANVNISALGGGTGTSNGNVNISSSANDATATSGNINLISNAGTVTGLGANINLTTNGMTGGPVSSATINLTANGGFSQITINGNNWSVDNTGDASFNGTLNVGALTTSPGCLYSDTAGLIHTNGANTTCASGGGGGIGGSGTSGFFALFSGSTTVGNGHLDDGLTTAGRLTSTEPITVADSSGTGGGLSGAFGTAPTASSSLDTMWADSGGFWKVNNGNSGAATLVAVAAAGTSGHCPQFAANGFYLVDSGAACGTGGGGSFTPTRTIDAGAGTGATITFVSGANDNTGWINITTGTAPAAASGVVTVVYGGTYGTVRKCFVEPSNLAASSLSGTAAMFVPQSTSATTSFVIQSGSIALAASTAYQVLYSCGT